MLSKNMHTQKHRWYPDVRQKQSVMAVLVSLLASGCQTQLTTVTRQKPSSEQCLDSSLLHERFRFENDLGPALSEKAGLKWALGQIERVCIHSHVYNIWEQILDFSDEWEGQNTALIGCASVSGENVNARLFPKLYWQSPLYHANIPAHRGALWFSWLPALSHTLRFQWRHSSEHFVLSWIFSCPRIFSSFTILQQHQTESH